MADTHRAALGPARPWSADEFARLLDSPHVLALGDARCFALLRIVADEAELLTIATHPDHRRQGLARAVLEHGRDLARARGAARIFLEVAADNSAATRLYESCGYRTGGRRRAYYRRAGGPDVDAVLMECRLP